VCVYVCVSLVKKGEELRSTELHGARKTGEKKLRGKSNPIARIVPLWVVCLSTKKGGRIRGDHFRRVNRANYISLAESWHRRHQMLTPFGRPPASFPPFLSSALSSPLSLSSPLRALSKLEVLESLRYRLINATSHLLKWDSVAVSPA